VLKQAYELGLETQWVVDVSIVSPEVPQNAGAEAAQGMIGLRAGSSQTPEYIKFHQCVCGQVWRRADDLGGLCV